MFLRLSLIAMILLPASLGLAQELALDPAVEARIKQVEKGAFSRDGKPLLKRMKKLQVPGVSIAVIDHGKIEWARGYGSLEAGSAQQVDPSTRFQAASISKSLTAMAAMNLVQGGQLLLDEDVNQTLKSWKVPESQWTAEQKVTLRRLLSHMAGTTVQGFEGYAAGAPLPTLVQVLQGSAPANSGAVVVMATPGSDFRYSGGGYTIAQQMILDVTREPFPDFMRKTVLEPLGMKSSSFEQPLEPASREKAATGYLGNGKPVPGKWYTYPEMAAAGLWTTPSDLCRFVIAVQQALHGESNRVISQESARQMLTRQKANYGLGLGLRGDGPTGMFLHEGANEGYQAVIVGFLETGQGAAIMTNSDNGSDVFHEVLRSLSYIYQWPQH